MLGSWRSRRCLQPRRSRLRLRRPGPQRAVPVRRAPEPASSGAARSGPVTSGTGIVQAVRPHAVVVRRARRRALLVLVGPRTAVFVNGVGPALAQVRPGFVVTFSRTRRQGRRRAARVRLRRLAATAWRQRAVRLGRCGRRDAPNGSTATIAVGPRTRVFLNGRPASIARHPRRATCSSRSPATPRASARRARCASGGLANIG